MGYLGLTFTIKYLTKHKVKSTIRLFIYILIHCQVFFFRIFINILCSLNLDELVKSRHSGENRSPETL